MDGDGTVGGSTVTAWRTKPPLPRLVQLRTGLRDRSHFLLEGEHADTRACDDGYMLEMRFCQIGFDQFVKSVILIKILYLFGMFWLNGSRIWIELID